VRPARRRLLLAATLGLSAACSGAPTFVPVQQADVALDAPVVLELLPNRLPVVAVRLDDRHERPFIIDCGAGMTFLDARVATELGLAITEYSQPFTALGVDGHQATISRCARLESLEVGPLALDHVVVPLLETDLFPAQSVAGLLGQDLLARLPFLVDVERGRLHLLPPATARQGIIDYLSAADVGDGDWIVVEAKFDPCPFLPLEVEGLEPLEIEIDTGAGMMCLPQRAVDAMALEPVSTGEAPGLAGMKAVRTYQLENFDLFGVRITTEVQATSDDYGLLGMDVLGQFVLLVDGPGRTIWLHRRAAGPP